jgi:hypothetical protein
MSDPVITLGGKPYVVPMLAPKQNRIVVPTMCRLRGMNPASITTEQYDDLLECAFLAAQRGTPSLNKVEFMDSPISTIELIEAMQVIMQQTGAMRKADASGEAQKAESSQTGIG